MLDPLLLSTLLAAISTGCLVLFGLVDIKQWRALSKIEKKVDVFQMGNIGDQLGEWLLDTEGPDQPTNLEKCSSLVGKQIAGSFSMGLKGIASGESRTIKSVEKALLEGMQTPETQALLEATDRLGLPRELAGILYDVAERRGLLDKVLKNNGHTGGDKTSW